MIKLPSMKTKIAEGLYYRNMNMLYPFVNSMNNIIQHIHINNLLFLPYYDKNLNEEMITSLSMKRINRFGSKMN